ncbi:MAG: SPOR domain-containing protein, partial [Bacteroidota bacterium]
VTAPAGSGGLKGDEPLDPSAGGYTWSSRTLSIAQEGVPMTRVLRGADFRTAVLQDRETGAFIVAIGQFQTPEAAQAVQNQLPAWAQAAGVVVQISSYQLVDGDLQP